ncbi:MAG: hypothetical protein MRY57_00865 [Candidatus Pacebacteria bacterium]|nr:hypothetical protein [Candidatus Paceibacterota bacterium]
MSKYFVYLILFSFFQSCAQQTRLELLETEYIEPEVEGKVIDVEIWKGDILAITVDKKEDNRIGVINYRKILDQIRPGQYFKKVGNSNKCYVRNNDSILYFDIINLDLIPLNLKDSLKHYARWPEEKLYKSFKIDK